MPGDVRVIRSALRSDNQPVEPDAEIAAIICDMVQEEIEGSISRRNISVAVGSILLFIAVLMAYATSQYLIGIVFLVFSISTIAFGLLSRPGVEVKSIGKFYWSGLLVPFNQERSLLVDCSSVTPPKTINFSLPSDQKSLEEKLESVVATSQKIVEHGKIFNEDRKSEGLTSHESVLIGALEDISELSSSESIVNANISLPIFEASSELSKKLMVDLNDEPVRQRPESVFQNIGYRTAESQIASLRGFHGRKGEALDFLGGIRSKLSINVELLLKKYNESMNLVGENLALFNRVLSIHSHEYLCPICILEDVSSRMLYDPVADRWTCPLCVNEVEPRFSTIRVHKIKNDLLNDIWDNLWIEKTDVRNQAIDDISNQKRNMANEEYKEKQQTLREFNALVKGLESKMRDLRSDVRAGLAFAMKLGELMRKYEFADQARIEQYLSQADEVQKQVDGKYDSLRGAIRAFEDVRMKKAVGETAYRSRVKAWWNNYKVKEKTKGLRKIYQELGKAERVKSIDEAEAFGLPLSSTEYFSIPKAELKGELVRLINKKE